MHECFNKLYFLARSPDLARACVWKRKRRRRIKVLFWENDVQDLNLMHRMLKINNGREMKFQQRKQVWRNLPYLMTEAWLRRGWNIKIVAWNIWWPINLELWYFHSKFLQSLQLFSDIVGKNNDWKLFAKKAEIIAITLYNFYQT